MTTTTTAPLDRATLARRLLAWPGELAAAERQALDTATALVEARRELQNEEDAVRVSRHPKELGENEAMREAQIREMTHGLRAALGAAEQAHREAVSQLAIIKAEGSAMRAVARLLGGHDG